MGAARGWDRPNSSPFPASLLDMDRDSSSSATLGAQQQHSPGKWYFNAFSLHFFLCVGRSVVAIWGAGGAWGVSTQLPVGPDS